MSSSSNSTTLSSSEIDLLTIIVTDERSTRAIWIASLAILVYDRMLIFDQEVAYLKTCRSRWTRALFLVNSYWPFIYLPINNLALSWEGLPEHFCRFWYNFLCYGNEPIHITIGIILIQRIYAMYDCNKILRFILSIFLVIQVAVELIVMGPIAAYMKPIHLPLRNSLTCFTANPTRHIFAYWLPMVTFESMLFVAAVLKVIQVARHEPDAPRILAVLLRDSVTYFGGVFAIIVTNLVVWSAARLSLVGIAYGPVMVAPAILGSRMLINIHEAAQPKFGGHASIFGSSFVRSELRLASEHARYLANIPADALSLAGELAATDEESV